MTRSFTDRVFGGVCGGLAASLPVNAWILRALFIILTPVTFGLAALTYVLLWWALPQESLMAATRGRFFRFLLVLVIIGGVGVLGVGRSAEWLMTENGTSLFFPALLALSSTVFLLRQVNA